MEHDVARYDRFWAAFFGIEAAGLDAPGVRIVRHALLRDYPGVWFFVRGSTVVVSAPDAWFDRLHSQRAVIRDEPLPSARLLRDLFGTDLDRVIGPAYHGYLSREAFRSVRRPGVRRLASSDGAALTGLRSACTAEEWEHSALSSAGEPQFGCFEDGLLVAAAGADRWTADAINPGVLSRPDRRGQGYGTAVVSAVVEDALASGKLPLYQTLLDNNGAVAIAERIGYRQYASHVAVRLQPMAG